MNKIKVVINYLSLIKKTPLNSMTINVDGVTYKVSAFHKYLSKMFLTVLPIIISMLILIPLGSSGLLNSILFCVGLSILLGFVLPVLVMLVSKLEVTNP